MEVKNKVYGLQAWGKITTAFETKEDVEDYLRICKNIVSCYNPNNDSWSTSGEFSIIPIDRALTKNIGFYPYAKNCNKD